MINRSFLHSVCMKYCSAGRYGFDRQEIRFTVNCIRVFGLLMEILVNNSGYKKLAGDKGSHCNQVEVV